VNLPFSLRRELLENLLAAADDPLRVSPLLRAPSTQVLDAVRKLVWKASSENGSIPSTNPVSDQARGSSTARTESRNSSLAVISLLRTGSMRCSSAFTRTTNSSLSRK
jgi:hypothetical protein